MTTKSVKESWVGGQSSSSSRFRFDKLRSYYNEVLTKSKTWSVLFKNYDRDIKKFKDDNPNFTNDDLDTFYERELGKEVRNRTKRLKDWRGV